MAEINYPTADYYGSMMYCFNSLTLMQGRSKLQEKKNNYVVFLKVPPVFSIFIFLGLHI